MQLGLEGAERGEAGPAEEDRAKQRDYSARFENNLVTVPPSKIAWL